MAKYSAYGTQLKRIAATIAQVRNLGGPELTADTIDVTTHDSTAAWREFLAGLIDGGEVTVELVFDPDNTGHAQLRDDLIARAPVAFSVTFPDATPSVWSFSALVTRFAPVANVDADLMANVTLKTTGAVSFA